MNYAYARVSTDKQEHNRQTEILKGCHIDKTYFEVVSGGKKATEREVFAKMCENLKEGDYIYFADMSRLGRSTIDLVETVELLKKDYKVNLVFLKENIKIGDAFKDDPVSTLMFHIFASFAEFERNLLRQRTKDGLEAAKAQGRVGGRPRDSKKKEEVIDLLRLGYTQKDVAKKVGLTQAYVSKIKCEYQKEHENDDRYIYDF